MEETSGATARRGSASPHRRYYMFLRRSRLMAVAFWVATGYFFFWAVPWFPGGLSEKDYTERVALTVLLGGVCAVLGVGTLILREYLRRTREALLAWTTVYDDATGLYPALLLRLSLECSGHAGGDHVLPVVMRFEHGGAQGADGPAACATGRRPDGATRSGIWWRSGRQRAGGCCDGLRKMVPQVIERLQGALEGSCGLWPPADLRELLTGAVGTRHAPSPGPRLSGWEAGLGGRKRTGPGGLTARRST
jgi:hypothetical protein